MNTDQPPEPFVVLDRLLREGFSGGDTRVVDELCSPDFVEHQFGFRGSPAESIEKIKRGIDDLHRGMPDFSLVVDDWVVQGDTVWTRATATGTQTGPFIGPPTGRAISITVFDVARVVDGRLVEHWGVPDRFAMLAQTGALDRLHG